MREIEFRGKSELNNKWVYGSYMKSYFSSRFGLVSAIFYNDYNTNKTLRIPIYENTIGQYTGLKDKNGKKIFEGDIVKDQYCVYEVAYDGNGYYIKVIKLLKECGTYIGPLYDLSDYKDLEVIGNIYDNPELLEEKI